MARAQRLTAAVQRVVERDTIYAPPIDRLTPSQIEALAEVARAPQRFATPVSAPRAIAALVRGAKAASAVPVLTRVLGSRTADVPSKIAAANGLAQTPTPEAERALWRGIGDDVPPRVAQEALWALGAIGSPAALRRLARLPEPREPGTRRQLAFARALIAHRHGLEVDVPAPIPDEALRRPEQVGHRLDASLALQAAADTRKDTQRLEGTTYGIALGGRAAYLSCGAEWTVFLNRDVDPAAMATQLMERPWVLGLMARRRPDLRALSIAQVILTRPAGDLVRVDVMRPDGTRLYTGQAIVDGRVVRFTMGDVHRPGMAPAFLRFHVGPREAAIDEAAVSGRRAAVRQPIGMPIPRASDKEV